MIKLFEIPVYAMSREKLSRKCEQVCAKLRSEHVGCSEDHVNAIVALSVHPQRQWDYNHIVGYIKISANCQDIIFDVFLPTPQRERYLWQSGQKVFLYNISANGTHFYVSERMNNRAIQDRTAEMLCSVIKTHIPSRYYVDTEAFDHLNKHMDYRSIMEDAENGQNEL
jgi:hypothetical protein